jgi:hypothetical protein
VHSIPFSSWPRELQRARRLTWAENKTAPEDLSQHGGPLTEEEGHTAFRLRIGDLTATGFVADLHYHAELFQWREQAEEAISAHVLTFPSCQECLEKGVPVPEPYFPEWSTP